MRPRIAFFAACALYPVEVQSSYSFNPLEHLAGIAPPFDPLDPPLDPAPPLGCNVTRAAYLVRHAAIHANDFDYETYIEPFVAKLRNTSVDWKTIPDLAFLAAWQSPITPSEQEMLTRAGKLEATKLGVDLAQRYPGFRTPSKIWSSTANRTIQSAQSLMAGLAEDPASIELVQVSEGKQEGADSLTPYRSCPAYSGATGSVQAKEFQGIYTRPITARFNAAAPAFNFTAADVTAMAQLCGYETVIRGASPFCALSLLSANDWLGFEYANDLMYYHNTGPASPVAGAIGFPWLNATLRLLLAASPPAGAGAQDLYVSFTHRELPPTVLVALGLFNDSGATTMPTHRINHRRAWRSSHILPFLATVALERLACAGPGIVAPGEHYRVLVNNSPQPLPTCADGPGESCSRPGLLRVLGERAALFADYAGACRVDYANSTDVLGIYGEA